MISIDDYLTTHGKHRDRLVHVTEEIRGNAELIVGKVNALLERYGTNRLLTSGYRDPTSNATAGGAKYSWHMQGLAADIDDLAGNLGEWVLDHETALVDIGLFAEDPRFTSGWVHVQTEPPRSGKRVFKP